MHATKQLRLGHHRPCQIGCTLAPDSLLSLRPSPGLIQELAGFCMNMHAVLLECRAHSTSRHRDRNAPALHPLHHPAARCQQEAAVAGGPRTTRMAAWYGQQKRHTKALKETGRPPPSHRGRRWRWDPWHSAWQAWQCLGSPHPSRTIDKAFFFGGGCSGSTGFLQACHIHDMFCIWCMTCMQSSPFSVAPWARFHGPFWLMFMSPTIKGTCVALSAGRFLGLGGRSSRSRATHARPYARTKQRCPSSVAPLHM